ncbi:MAG TPA: DUF4097 family beta strand repeat-containing protein [Candidatus Saccharimonadales bacterium]|nr:DUF4097 family beta strand repeat-containing protein [Candidatus Saccharimonadales bacterium]
MRRLVSTLVATLLLVAPAAAETVRKSFSVGSGGTLKIDLETGGDVDVVGGNGGEVSVTAELLEWDPSAETLTIDSSGDTVRIRTTRSRDHQDHYSSRITFHVKVPDRFDVDVDSSGGDLGIRNVEGTFSGRTMGGDLMLREVRGEVGLETMGGDVQLQDADVKGRLTTDGGDLALTRVAGNLEASTMGGDIALTDVGAGVNVRTMGGDVMSSRREGPPGGAADGPVKLKTMGGDISVDDAPLGADLETNGGDIVVVSAGQSVEATTYGGDINLRKVDGKVKATTHGGDVTVRLVDEGAASDHDVELSSGGGDVSLIVPSGFSMDIDVEITWTRDYHEKPVIHSDFPLSTSESSSWDSGNNHGGKGPGTLITGKGSVEGGRNHVVIRTTNGDVTIRRG